MSFSKTFIQEKLIGTPGQIVSFDADNNAIVTDLTSVSGKSVILNVTAPDNVSRVIVSNGVYSYEYNFRYLDYDSSDSDNFVTSEEDEFYVQDDNVHTFYLPMLGDWAVAAVKGGISTTTSIYVDHVGTYNVSLSYFNAYIPVTYPIGAICTCSNGIDIYYADNTDGSYTFTVNRASDWTINVYNPEISKTATQVVSVTRDGETLAAVNVTYLKDNLDENDWPTIRYTISTGEADDIWHVGDVKKVTLNGTFGSTAYSNYEIYAQLVEFNHNTAIESASKPTATFQLGMLKNPNADNAPVNVALIESDYGTTSGDFVINSTADNTTGWADSALRTLLNSTEGSTLINCLPQELVEMLMEVNKYTAGSESIVSTRDKLFIPSEIEINGTASVGSNQLQYSYYASNSKVRYENTALTTACNWWLRTPYLTGSNTTDFCTISTSGTVSHENANYSYGIAPMFVIGG